MNFVVRRVLTYVVVLIVAVNLIFILPRLVPGTASTILSEGNKFAPAQAALLAQRFGLNKPLYVQYELYLKNVFLTWPPYFGVSFQFFPEQVSYLFLVRFPWTVLLIACSFVIATLLSYAMVALSSIRRGGRFELSSLYASITFHAIPIYWTAIVLLWVFGAWLRWFPISGNAAFGNTSGFEYATSVIYHSILPVLALSISMLGEDFLLLRGSTQETLKNDFVVAAKIRGIPGRLVATKYILRNSMLPFISILSFSVASLISRVILVESIFGYPGVGDLIVDAIANRDYPVLEGSLFYVVLMVIIGGLIGDLLLTRLDPRIRRG